MENYPASFTKAERLCGVKAINDLFASGKTLNTPLFRVIYCIMPASDEKATVRLLISIPKKIFKKAVTRNLLRRRIREAYRKHKSVLINSLEKSVRRTEIAILWREPRQADYNEIETSVTEFLSRISRMKY